MKAFTEKATDTVAEKNKSNCDIHQERILPCIDNTFAMMSNLKKCVLLGGGGGGEFTTKLFVFNQK